MTSTLAFIPRNHHCSEALTPRQLCYDRLATKLSSQLPKPSLSLQHNFIQLFWCWKLTFWHFDMCGWRRVWDWDTSVLAVWVELINISISAETVERIDYFPLCFVRSHPSCFWSMWIFPLSPEKSVNLWSRLINFTSSFAAACVLQWRRNSPFAKSNIQ